MTEVQVGTFGRAASIAVEAVGRQLIEVGLGGDGSLLTPGEPIWTLANLEKLKTEYVDKPDMGSEGFFEKLKRQLVGASPAVIQLYAELLILNVLPIINVGGELKVKQVEIVLNLSSDPVTLPDDVRAALLGGGVFHGGQAFTTCRWAQIAYLIQFALHFKGLSEQRRLDSLAERLIFREEIASLTRSREGRPDEVYGADSAGKAERLRIWLGVRAASAPKASVTGLPSVPYKQDRPSGWWTLESFVEAVDNPGDRAFLLRFLKLVAANSLLPRKGKYPPLVLGMRPGGGIFVYPFGRRHPPFKFLLQQGNLMIYGCWTKFPAVKGHAGVGALAEMLDLDEKGSERAVPVADFDADEVWNIGERVSQAIN